MNEFVDFFMPCAGMVHFREDAHTLALPKKMLDGLTMDRSTSGDPYVKRQIVNVYRVLESATNRATLQRSNRIKDLMRSYRNETKRFRRTR